MIFYLVILLAVVLALCCLRLRTKRASHFDNAVDNRLPDSRETVLPDAPVLAPERRPMARDRPTLD